MSFPNGRNSLQRDGGSNDYYLMMETSRTAAEEQIESKSVSCSGLSGCL